MLILGSELNGSQRNQVLGAFGYRWTLENKRRATNWHGVSQPTIALQSDEQWLAEHAFYFVADGSRLMANRRHCEPSYIAMEGTR